MLTCFVLYCKGPVINYVTLSGGGEGVSSCIVVQIVGRMVFIMLLRGLGVKLGTKLCCVIYEQL